jgi:hypothetical protein
MKYFALLWLVLGILLAGCEPSAPTSVEHCVPFVNIKLTPAPPGETPLQRWKRTKADWETVTQQEDKVREQLTEQSLYVFEAYITAEKELQSIQCGKICVPEKQQ